jgi:glycosyltransferase involved in cell wall biosynthesis
VAGRGEGHDEQLVLPLLTLGDPQRLTGGYLYHQRMAEAAPRHAATITFLSFPERPFPWAAFDAPRVFADVRSLGAQAVLLDSMVAAVAAPWLAVRRPPAPVIGVLHQLPGGVDRGRWATVAQATLDRLAYRRARRLVVTSELLAGELVTQGFADEQLHVVPPGRDVPSLPDGPSPDLRHGRATALLCVGNWLAHKGILELLEAFAAISPGAGTLHLVGDEDVQPEYARRVRRRLAAPDLAGRVVRHGPLPREDLASLYAGADVFVLPAFRETYGMVWGEAMTFGLPVVGWRAGNLPRLVTDGREGILAAPGDVRALAGALSDLAVNEALRLRLGAAARRRALARPTWEESAARFFAVVRGALSAGDRAGQRGRGAHA